MTTSIVIIGVVLIFTFIVCLGQEHRINDLEDRLKRLEGK